MNIKVSKNASLLARKLKSSVLASVLDEAAKETAAFGIGKIMRETPMRTGQTRRGWNSAKVRETVYKIWNRFLHAQFLETGTGLFGPLKKEITPRTAKFLVWETYKKNTPTGLVFAKTTKGMKAQPMIEPNKEIIQEDINKRVRNKIRKLWVQIKRGA